ncbi:hypothetical protein ACFL3G_05080 [Planctomycetota bacterium]
MAETIEAEVKKKSALSGWPMIIGWIAMMIFAFHACTHMVGAGDTWVAMACGRHFINHGVDTVEPFSANSHNAGPTEEEVETWPGWAQWITEKVGLDTVKYWHPTGWVNQNWLTHVIFYWVTSESPFADAENFSFNTLVYWKFAVYILTIVCVYYMTRLLGVNPALSAVFACFTLFIGRSFFDVRPAGFSNLCTAAFLLILTLATYRKVWYIWLIVPLTVFWCNVHGGYIYIFIMLVPFFGFHFLTSFTKKGLVSIGRKGLYHTAWAGVAAFLGSIVFNPFHLTNLTHTFVISVSEHAKAWRTVNEWHPAFEWGNPVGDEIPFLIMYIICWVLLLAWIVSMIVTSKSVKSQVKRKSDISGSYQWPKVDLALIAIAALSIYMAICSRRFIPIAAMAACPLMALYIEQIVRAISATRNFHKKGELTVPVMPRPLQKVFVLIGIAAVLFFGLRWGFKFNRIYLAAWPTDEKLNSVFMRMTASDAKPFYATQFMRDNKMSGKMFNYWTEGGFIGYGQVADPNTGKTPLQLFMDGRAQAAYSRKDYDRWAIIMAGGPVYGTARARKQKITPEVYRKTGEWLDKKLKGRGVWVVLMPAGQFDSAFVKALEHNTNWVIVFMNNKQRLFVDRTTAGGKKLFEGIFNGQTVFPDEFSRNLVLARNMILFGKGAAAKRRGLEHAFKAFELYPSQAPLVQMMFATRYSSELRPDVLGFCKGYAEQFEKNRKQYIKEDGYFHKVVAALVCNDVLNRGAKAQKDEDMIELYSGRLREYRREKNILIRNKRW